MRSRIPHSPSGRGGLDKYMIIRKAVEDEYEKIRAFYHSLIDEMNLLPYGAGWIKDVYPSREMIRSRIDAGEYYIVEEEGSIAGAMIVNHSFNEGYRKFDWPTKAEDHEVTVIHALGVHPRYSGKGVAKQMVGFVIKKAKEEGQKAIRLDVLKGNLPAERLYSGLGFKYLHTLKMYYDDTDWTDYELYEYAL